MATSRPGVMTAPWPGCTAGLRAQVRQRPGDGWADPAVIDSQSVRAADTVPKASRDWDNAKKVDGRKRHIAVDTMGLVLDVVITPASVQDRHGARPLLWNTHRACRRVRLIWADAGYAGKLADWAATLKMTLQIVAKRDRHAFEVLPRRWVVDDLGRVPAGGVSPGPRRRG